MAENCPKIKDLTQIQEPQNTETGFKNKQKLIKIIQTHYCKQLKMNNAQCRRNTDGRQEKKDTLHIRNR